MDVAQLIILCALFIFGATSNVFAFYKLTFKKTNVLSTYECFLHRNAAPFRLLQKHLIYANFLVFFVYLPTSISAIFTGLEWHGGAIMCRVVPFAYSLGFYLCSNVTVCIAFDRLMAVVRIRASRNRKRRMRFVKMSLVVAWLVAILSSVPQLLIFSVFSVADLDFQSDGNCTPNHTVDYCGDIWSMEHYLMSINTTYMSQNHTGTMAQNAVEKLYQIFHVIMVFYIPFLLIFLFYSIICIRLFYVGRQQSHYLSRPAQTRCCAWLSRNAHSKTFLKATLLVSAYVICWAPYNIMIYAGIVLFSSDVPLKYLYHLIIFNSALSPFIYGFGHLIASEHRTRQIYGSDARHCDVTSPTPAIVEVLCGNGDAAHSVESPKCNNSPQRLGVSKGKTHVVKKPRLAGLLTFDLGSESGSGYSTKLSIQSTYSAYNGHAERESAM